jgi:hypothetical protein
MQGGQAGRKLKDAEVGNPLVGIIFLITKGKWGNKVREGKEYSNARRRGI